MTDLSNISAKTLAHVQTLFKQAEQEDADLRASMTPEAYRRHKAERDLAYCRARLDPDFPLFIENPTLRPDEKLKDAYRARIRDLEHFLKTGSHIDEDDL